MSERKKIQDENNEITISSIIALGFRYIKSVFIALILGFIIFGSYKGSKLLKAESTPVSNKAVQDYVFTSSILNTKFSALQTQFDYLSEKYNNSALMTLKSTSTVKAVITMAVNSENTANQYVNYFNSIRLSDIERELAFFEITATNNIEIGVNTGTSSTSYTNANTSISTARSSSVTSQDLNFDKDFRNCFLKLTVYGENENEALDEADSLLKLIQGGKDIVTAISGEHNLMIIDRYTESGADIAEKQYVDAVRLDAVADELATLNKSLSELENTKPADPSIVPAAPSFGSILKSSVKWAIIGAILGAFLVCLYLLISFIGKAPVTSSFEFADRTGLSYLGGFFKKRSWNERTADRLLNERVFASDADASAFITENVKALVKTGAKVLVASSFYKASDRENADVAVVMNALQAAGCNAEFAGDALTSAAFVAKLGKTDSVIILEKRWNSRWQNIGTELETVARLEKDVAGFVLA